MSSAPPFKDWMRQRLEVFDSFRDCVDAAFKQRPNVVSDVYMGEQGLEVLQD